MLAYLLHIAEPPETSLKAKRCLDLLGDEGRMAVALASDLEDAIEVDGQIFLEFQPQVDFRTGRIFGAEALLRWEHPFLGRVAPPIVVTLADEVNEIHRLGLDILSIACRQRDVWRNLLPDDFIIAVNLSPWQSLDPEFHRKGISILHRGHISPSLLKLEITESTMLLPDVNAIDNLKRLREVGVKVALDRVKSDRSLVDISPISVNEHRQKHCGSKPDTQSFPGSRRCRERGAVEAPRGLEL